MTRDASPASIPPALPIRPPRHKQEQCNAKIAVDATQPRQSDPVSVAHLLDGRRHGLMHAN